MSKVIKSTIILMIVTLLSKVLGFGRELALTSVYGPGVISDSFITAMNIPVVVFATIGTALSTTFIPLYYEVQSKKGNDNALKFTNNVFNTVIILSIVLSILGFIFAEQITKVFAMDFTGEKLLLATKFTRIMIFSMVFIGLNNIMTCWLQIKGNFAIPGMISIPYNVIIILSIIISTKTNVNILAIGTLFAVIVQFLFQLPYAIKNNYKYKLTLDLKDEYIRKMLILVLPVFIGVGVNQMDAVVDRSLASTLGDGIITILNSASKLNQFISAMFIMTIGAVLYPKLSQLSSNGNKKEFSNTIKQSISTVILLIMPITVGAIVLAEPIVKIIFQRGQFGANDTHLTAIALIGYSLGMTSVGINDILNRIFYSLKDTKTPMVTGAITMILNIGLNIILMKYLGHFGLSVSTSISATVCIFILFVKLNKKIGNFGQMKIISTTIKSLISSLIMGLVTVKCYNFIIGILGSGFIFEAISLLSAVLIGAIIYGILVMILKVDEIIFIIDILKSKLKFKQNTYSK